MKKLAVYCGSSAGGDPVYTEVAKALGRKMAAEGIGLVYGGGRLGLMGTIADTVLENGGKVDGVIPEMLKDHEVAHTGVTELYVVDNMHQRKAKMTELTDAFVALPGGIGTLDELFEAWTWHTLGYHAKPFALLNVNGYWDRLVEFLDHVAGERFMSPARRALLIDAQDVDEAIERLRDACANGAEGVTW